MISNKAKCLLGLHRWSTEITDQSPWRDDPIIDSLFYTDAIQTGTQTCECCDAFRHVSRRIKADTTDKPGKWRWTSKDRYTQLQNRPAIGRNAPTA